MLIFLFMMACGGKSTEDEEASFEWSSGDFQFQTVDVDDQCLGGALEALFMPEGPATPHNFEYLIYLPGYEELPVSYTVDLREPFVEMPVTVDSDDNRVLKIRGSVMEAVELGRATYGDCVVTMTVDLNLQPTSSSKAKGEARIIISDPRGDDGLCPIFDESPCPVDLSLTATRD